MARKPKLLLVGLICLGVLTAAPAALASVNLRYWGGPVANSMNVQLVEWGSSVNSEYTDPNSGDPAFFSYLASQSGTTTDIGGVLAQYMDTAGVNAQNQLSYGGLTQITPPSSGGVSGCALPTCVDDSVIQSTLQSQITSGALPTPVGTGLQTIYVVLFSPGTDVCLNGTCAFNQSSGFCAYHGAFQLPSSSTQVLYAPIVDDGSGTPNAGECGEGSGDVANQTEVISHELAEAITDPLVSEAAGNGPPLGWYDLNNGEVADICVSPTADAANGSWTVQKIWSNRDANCVAGESAYSAPKASFVADTTASAGAPVSFDASSSSDPAGNTASAMYARTSYSIGSGLASYSWDWGDGTPGASSSSPTATHTYASPGNYQVSLTVTDNLGFTSTVTQEIAIAGSPAAPDVTTGSASAIDSQDATVSGTINPENQDVQYSFVYGTSPSALGQSTPITSLPVGTTADPVSAVLSNLTPSTLYYYALKVVTGGQTYTGSVQTFTTSAAPAPAPPVQAPQASSGVAALITSTSAQLEGSVNPGGDAAVTYWFTYGTSPANLDRSTPQATMPGGSTFVPVSADLSGLSPGTTYYYSLQVSLGGNTTSGAVQDLTTLTPAPSATTGAASQVTSSGATVAGAVNPNGVATTYQVQFGPSTGYGYSSAPVSAGNGTASQAVSVSLSGLKPGTTYHYRLVASDLGGTAVGADRTFTTTPALAPAPKFSFRVLGRPALPRVLGRGLKTRFTCNQACVARFSVVVLPANGVLRAGSVPLSIASGTGRLHTRGSATVILRFSGKARKRLAGAKLLRLSISGVAAGSGTAASSPVLHRLTVHRRPSTPAGHP